MMEALAASHGPTVRADYIDVSSGQIHRLTSRSPRAAANQPPLYCLHATAYSGRTFLPLMASLPDRVVCALDAPGYGASTRPADPWTLSQYAAALTEAIVAAGERHIDLLGYHTGALLAAEIAAHRPDLVRRVVLIGVPYFPAGPEREERRRTLGAPMRLTETLGQFQERWEFFVSDRAPGVTLEQGFAHFVDELRAWPYGYWAHEAAFTHEPSGTFTDVTQPTLILNPRNHLAGPSRAAARLVRKSVVIELSDADRQVLDLNPAQLAAWIEPFLSEDSEIASAMQLHSPRNIDKFA